MSLASLSLSTRICSNSSIYSRLCCQSKSQGTSHECVSFFCVSFLCIYRSPAPQKLEISTLIDWVQFCPL